MPRLGSSRSIISAVALASAGLGILGFSTISFGAAVVGESRKVEITQKAQSGLDALKAQYRRPATIPFPKENAYTPQKAALGKKLYFDTRLSVSMAQSCASCHGPGFGWGATALPSASATAWRSSAGIRRPSSTWPGARSSCGTAVCRRSEEQALGPIQAAGEMNMNLDKLMERPATIPEYKPMFEAAFPGEGMKPKTLAQAIATYERTVVSGRAPFDAWIEGNEKAISEDAKRGFALFDRQGAMRGLLHRGLELHQ